jgi:hypothetical protein
MNDEQTIYISPEDDLTTLRERLEQIPSPKITLVIPNQTQLRSHVAWKLLYARARELGKEVLIVSSDPQIRSVAHAVKFKVVHSLETHASPQRTLTRRYGGSNAGRSNIDSHRSRLNTPPGVRGIRGTTTRGSRTRQENPSSSRLSRPLPQRPSSPPSWSEPSPSALSDAMHSRSSFINDPATRLPEKPLPLGKQQPERPKWKELRETPNKPSTTKNSESYEFRIEQTSHIQPLSIHLVEDPDLLLEDYTQAQNILQAASQPALSEDRDGPAMEPNKTLSSSLSDPQPATQQFEDDDPFIYTQDDSQPPSQPEQMGEATIEEFDSSPEYPQSSQGAAFDLDTRSDRDLTAQFNDSDESISPISSIPPKQGGRREERLKPSERNQTKQAPKSRELRPSTNHTEMQIPSQSPFDVDDDNPLPLPEQAEPPRVLQPLPLPQKRVESKSLTMQVKPQSSRLSAQKSQSRTSTQSNGRSLPPSATPPRPISQKHIPTRPKSIRQGRQSTNRPSQGSRRWILVACIAALMIIILAVVSVIYLNISSTVNISVATQNYKHQLTLTLSSQKQPNTVPARQITQTFTKTMLKPATGNTTQGTISATGLVHFTNLSNVQIQIPSKLILKTTNDIEFETTVNAIIQPQANKPIQIPVSVQAKLPGTAGNVAEDSITVIPPESLAIIARDQITPIAVDDLKQNLTITNPTATTGGDASQVAAIAQADLDTAKENLRQSAQEDINRWFRSYQQEGFVGQPTTTDTLVNPPAVGTAEPDKTFSATLNMTATVLVADRADIQKGALRALNAAIQADQRFGPKFAILGDFQTLEIAQVQPSGDNANRINLEATGQAGPNLDIPALQKKISGKPLDQAQIILKQEEPKDIQKIDIQTQPNILGAVSPWANHINIIVQPVAKQS